MLQKTISVISNVKYLMYDLKLILETTHILKNVIL